MSKLRNIYRRNIYGVMGTLIFHILLFAVFLLADIDIKGNVKEEDIVIDFPDVLPEPEEIQEEEKIEEQEETSNESSQQNSESQQNMTNRASNQLSTKKSSTKDKFFDDDYMKELEEAKSMVSNVSKQLSQEVTDINDIKMPVESTEGMNPDSIKNVVYSGESNITYYLENRYHLRLPIPVYLAQGGGKVIVDIVVNRQGQVIQATARKSSSIRDKNIYSYAEVAASKTVFNADSSAPEEQKGTIHYTFIAQ